MSRDEIRRHTHLFVLYAFTLRTSQLMFTEMIALSYFDFQPAKGFFVFVLFFYFTGMFAFTFAMKVPLHSV